MKCSYHPGNQTSVRCSSCDRGLCPACDHRIKGRPYCQDCIVNGIETLRRNGADGKSGSRRGEDKSPLIATLLGLIPGLGAAYNGQLVKALVHFAVTVGLGSLADIFHGPLEVSLGLGTAAFYIYSLYDAYNSAQRQRRGEDLAAEDEDLKIFLRKRTRVWGGMLIGIGSLSILNMFFPDQVYRFWPLLLILAGLFFLRGYRRIQTDPEPRVMYRTPPPSVIPSSYEATTGEIIRAESRYER